MLKRLLLALPLLALAGALGCTDTPKKERDREKLEEAGDEVKDYTREQMEQFRKDMDRKVQELDDQLVKWREKARDAKDDARREMDRKIADLEKARDRTRARLRELGDDSKRAWKDVRRGMEDA